ncbi:phage protein [Streptococcus pneumoniae]|nr:phage protein [Streptococcus pneumoniae]
MAETIQNTDNLLDLTKITEPFDLASALRYMKENGEFIRFVNGRRQIKDVETVWAFNQWGGTIATINVAVLLNHEFYIMKFDAEGNPDWTVPTVEPKE